MDTERSDETPQDRLGGLPPLGAVATRLERGLETFVDALLDNGFGLGRRHWRLLRWTRESVDEPTVDRFVAAAAASFDAAEARRIVDDLVGREWLDRDAAGGLALTDAGLAGFRAMRAAQDTTWDVVLRGLTEDEYARTVTAMVAMADNLERAIAAGVAR